MKAPTKIKTAEPVDQAQADPRMTLASLRAWALADHPAAPTAQQVRAARQLAGHTQAQAASMARVEPRAWRRWEDTGPGSRQISATAWELYLIKLLGFVPIK